MKKLLLTVERGDQGERLDRFIARRGAISRGEARRLLERGAVWVDGRRVKVASRQASPGQQIAVFLEEAGRGEPARITLPDENIIFEDSQLIAVNKPPFVPAQSTLASDRGNLPALVSKRVGRPVGLVHRLDLETSGITIFGKTKKATSVLAELFRQGLVRKCYLAICLGELPNEGRITLFLSPDTRRPGRFIASERGKVSAITNFEVLGRAGLVCVVALYPETGRTHQIRAHMAALDAPLAGDVIYGGPREISVNGKNLKINRVLLHAQSLNFPHPTTNEPLFLKAPIPEEIKFWLHLCSVKISDH